MVRTEFSVPLIFNCMDAFLWKALELIDKFFDLAVSVT